MFCNKILYVNILDQIKLKFMSQNQTEFFFFQKEELPNTNTYLKKGKYLGTFGTFILKSEMP
jgi:hypothetical protein